MSESIRKTEPQRESKYCPKASLGKMMRNWNTTLEFGEKTEQRLEKNQKRNSKYWQDKNKMLINNCLQWNILCMKTNSLQNGFYL